MREPEHTISPSLIGKEAGLVIFGIAAGLLSAKLVGGKAQKPLGLVLAAAGLAAAGPELTKLADKAINSRSTKRGSKRTLKGIRNAAGQPVDSEEDLENGLFV